MRLLDGSELAGFIKERQAKQVRALRQAYKTFPKLAIIQDGNNPVSDVYIRMKKRYAEDILVDVDVYAENLTTISSRISLLNNDSSVHGIIVQLPLSDTSATDAIVKSILPSKDVDGLGSDEVYISATATAIDWLMAGYNVTLRDKTIVVIGQGRLVGAPLTKLWKGAGHTIVAIDETVDDIQSKVRSAHIIVSATGRPGLLTSSMVQPAAVVVDAGTANDNGKIVGDVAEDVRQRDDLTITPEKGGVGPLTIAALFDNVITAARKTAEEKTR